MPIQQQLNYLEDFLTNILSIKYGSNAAINSPNGYVKYIISDKTPKGIALIKLATQRSAIMRSARLKPTMAYKCKGWQMARNLSMENATIVNTET